MGVTVWNPSGDDDCHQYGAVMFRFARHVAETRAPEEDGLSEIERDSDEMLAQIVALSWCHSERPKDAMPAHRCPRMVFDGTGRAVSGGIEACDVRA